MPRNIIVLDLETARSAEDCKHCGDARPAHFEPDAVCVTERREETKFEPIGWGNKPALGLSIGGYYSYVDEYIHWFDEHNLTSTIERLVAKKPLMVSFNGIGFDYRLMRGIVRRRAEPLALDGYQEEAQGLTDLCDAFKLLAANSYDILAEIWHADPRSRFTRSLNSLDSIAQANGFGPKLGNGAQAPRDWAAGRCANVMNYCSLDIYLTKWLFDMICEGKPIARSDGSRVQLSAQRIGNREGGIHA